MSVVEFVTDSEIYQKVTLGAIPEARDFLWIATSDLKDLYVNSGKKMVPLLKVLSDLIDKGVSIRLIHASEPGPRFREDFDKYPNLFANLERVMCPRVHFKSVVVDGRFAYTGSANLTGAGMGAKSAERRNFESGIISSDASIIDGIMKQFDDIWMGMQCQSCRRKEFCSEHAENLL